VPGCGREDLTLGFGKAAVAGDLLLIPSLQTEAVAEIEAGMA
jgi:hypothetical protein